MELVSIAFFCMAISLFQYPEDTQTVDSRNCHRLVSSHEQKPETCRDVLLLLCLYAQLPTARCLFYLI